MDLHTYNQQKMNKVNDFDSDSSSAQSLFVLHLVFNSKHLHLALFPISKMVSGHAPKGFQGETGIAMTDPWDEHTNPLFLR